MKAIQARLSKLLIPKKVLSCPLLVELWKIMYDEGRDNFICMIGNKGKGKSITAAIIALMLDPTFFANLEKQTVTSLADFAELIVDENNMHKVLILDESGLSKSASAMKWYEKDLQALRDILQVDRIRCQTKIMVAPRSHFIAKFARDLFNFMIEVIDKKKSAGYVTIKVTNYEVGQINDKVYQKFLVDAAGNRYRLFRVWKPSEDLIKRYAVHINVCKNDIMQQKIEEIRARADGNGITTEEKEANATEMLVTRIVEMFQTGEIKKLTMATVANKLGLTYSKASPLAQIARERLKDMGLL